MGQGAQGLSIPPPGDPHGGPGALGTGLVVFHAPMGYPVSASRAILLGAELVDSIGLLHGLEGVVVEPPWWRRLCRYTRHTACTGRAGPPRLRVLVVVDAYAASVPGWADLVYEMDTRRGTVLRLAPGRSSLATR